MRRLPIFLFIAALAVACNDTSGSSASAPRDEAQSMLSSGDYTGLSALLASERGAQIQGGERVLMEAQIALSAEDIPKAELLCREYHKTHPGDIPVADQLVQIYLHIGAGDRARQAIDSTLAANPEAYVMHYYSGLLHGKKGRLDEAAAAFEAAEAGGMVNADLQYNLAVLDYQQDRVSESIGRLRELTEKHPELASARRELARGLIAVGDESAMQEASALLDALSTETETDWRVWELLGLHSEQSGDLPAAQLYLTEALRHSNNSVQVEEAYLRVGRALIDAGQGDLVPRKQKNEDLPPVSAGMQQRFDEAKRAGSKPPE